MPFDSQRERSDQQEADLPMMTAGDQSTAQLADFLGGMSASDTEESAISSAVERAAEALDADSCVYVRNGEIAGSVGLPDDPASAVTILALIDGNLTDPSALEAADAGHTLIVPVIGELGSHLVLTRASRDFEAAERAMVRAMGGALSLTMGKLQTLHDQLTGLPNRSLLTERLAENLEAGLSEPAVIFMDLDSFRSINDRVGHHYGDEMLIEVGRRLKERAGDDVLVSRMEGNTFALLTTTESAQNLARKVLRALTEPFAIAGRELQTSASIGVVESGTDAEQMLRDADLAMYRAKSEGGTGIVTFEPSMHAERVRRLELQDDLARALGDEEIQTFFQPKVDLRSARVIGVEALVRWAHPERGLVEPSEFLDLAAAGGHMRALTERVIEFSIRVAGDWWRSGLGLQLSVNLSPLTFAEADWRLDEFVTDALARSGLPGTALQFEVTEDALMADPDVAAEILVGLSDLGITISIDDFGTGHSSLGRLKSLPVDELKIDRSFIANLTQDDEDKTVVRSTIHLAHQMGLQVVAEGVETEEAWRQLRSMGCERAQGFLIATPLPAREVPAWLAAWNQRARELRATSRTIRSQPKPERPAAEPEEAKTAA